MKQGMIKAALVFGSLFLSSMAFAQDGGVTPAHGLVAIGAALAIGLSAYGATAAQGRAASAALEGLARNPQAKDALFLPLILGLVFMEFQALLGFVIAFLWTNK